MSRVAERLARALHDAMVPAGVTTTLGPLTSRPWHSALFSGETHRADLTGVDDAAMTAWLARLPNLELPLSGHVVEIAVDRITRRDGALIASLALLTVET